MTWGLAISFLLLSEDTEEAVLSTDHQIIALPKLHILTDDIHKPPKKEEPYSPNFLKFFRDWFRVEKYDFGRRGGVQGEFNDRVGLFQQRVADIRFGERESSACPCGNSRWWAGVLISILFPRGLGRYSRLPDFCSPASSYIDAINQTLSGKGKTGGRGECSFFHGQDWIKIDIP
jgi:hypothetical protein